MDSMIPVINKLQDIFGTIGQQPIDIPQIVVVGSQSAGKSSVLENIVGSIRDFLPRGTGIVTRRPLILQLYTVSSEMKNEKGEEWGEFTHLPGQRFYDFGEIRNEIQRDTDKVSGTNKAISRQTINLKIYSPHVVNLTLVDLPGIVKVPFEGQPEDIEEQIRSLCYDFISKPNAIILAVSAANQDLANSDGLKMARSVDPEGKRTIGVLTKVDIMDHGTDCCEVLNMNNHSYPLRRGYIAVVNRSQLDIANNITIRSGLDKEIAFFQSHVKYRNFLEKCGTSTLAKTLNQTLVQIIREGLPGIRDSISKMLTDVQSKISSLGISVADQNSESKGSIILKMVSQFAKNIHDSLEGKSNPSHLLSESELYGGARINYIV